MKNIFKAVALLSASMISTASLASNSFDVEYLQKERMPIASVKGVASQDRLGDLKEKNAEVQKSIR